MTQKILSTMRLILERTQQMSDSNIKEKPVDYSQLFPGRFIKAGLFTEPRPTYTIADVDLEDLPQDDGTNKARGIVSLVESKMQLCLNRTNAECLKSMFGNRVRDWIGKRVTFCVEKDRDPSNPKTKVDAIRVFGSPDIDSDTSATIKLPKRKPYERPLKKTEAPGTRQRQQQPATQPAPVAAPQPAPEKPRGDIAATLAHVATLGDEGRVAFQAELRGKYTWTKEEGARLVAAFEAP
jgi:hypothetical protein